MITIKIYGKLRSYCNDLKVHTFHNCYNIKQALQALLVNYPKLSIYLKSNPTSEYKIFHNDTMLSERDLAKSFLFSGDTIKLIPYIRGAGDDAMGIVYIIIAIVLIVLSEGFYGWDWFGYGTMSTEVAVMMAASFAYSGISMLVTNNLVDAPGSYDSLADNKARDSYGFQGAPANLTSQGNPVPLGYGRMLVGSQVVSAGIFAQNI